MQSPPSDGLTLRNIALGAIASFIAAAIAFLFGRKQSNANAENTRADTAKTRAETSQIESLTVRDNANIMLGLIREAAAQAVTAERRADERDHWKQKAEHWEERAGQLQAQLEVQQQQLDKILKPNPKALTE